tara:strand:+ start:410 stop:850 length:441 start_codon:yes stop_codon:yes gene_type:complete
VSAPSTGPASFPDAQSNHSTIQSAQSKANFDETLKEETGFAMVQNVLNVLFTWFSTSGVKQTVPSVLADSGIEFYHHLDTSIRVSLEKTHQLPIDIAFYDNNQNRLNITITVAAELMSAFSNSRLEIERKLKKRLGKSVLVTIEKL